MEILKKIITYRKENETNPNDSCNIHKDEITLSIKKYEEVLQLPFIDTELKSLFEKSLNKCRTLKSLHNDYLDVSFKQQQLKVAGKMKSNNLERKKRSSEFLFQKLIIIEKMRDTVNTLKALKAERKILNKNNPATS